MVVRVVAQVMMMIMMDRIISMCSCNENEIELGPRNK